MTNQTSCQVEIPPWVKLEEPTALWRVDQWEVDASSEELSYSSAHVPAGIEVRFENGRELLVGHLNVCGGVCNDCNLDYDTAIAYRDWRPVLEQLRGVHDHHRIRTKS